MLGKTTLALAFLAVLGVAANKEQASSAFKRACDMNFAKGCTHLAQLLSQ